MEENKNLESSLFESLRDNATELAGEIGELTIDQFIDNDVLKEIPFFSLFYKSVKTIQGVRNALFAMKVYKFMREFGQIKQKDKDKFLGRVMASKKEKTKVGQVLIMILDKIDDLDKTQIIANIFAAYIKEDISISEFIHLSSIVQNAFLDYLLIFGKAQNYKDLDFEIQANLASIGIMIPVVMDIESIYGNSVNPQRNDNMIVYVASKVGQKIKKYAFIEDGTC